jgi:N-acyl-D-aspartate/D-glutamate deacylase
MTLLRGAKLVDGTGSPAREADVRIEDDRIVEILEPGAATKDEDVIDLDGLVLAPGFIDCHTHYDAQILWDRDLTPSCWHGVTTVVLGNCGFGIAPTKPGHREAIARTLENVEGMSVEALAEGIPWTFETFPEYLDAIDAAPTRLNTAVLLGHSPLRLYVLGDDATERAATTEEVEEMRRITDEAIEAGAIGFASSKNKIHAGAWGKPVPSRLSTPDELFGIGRALGDRGRGTFQITRGTDFQIPELARLSKDTGRPVTWTALVSTPDATDDLAKGTELGGDVYPQVSCRPIIMQLTLEDPGPLARASSFADVLSKPREERAAIYADHEWREQAKPAFDRIWGGHSSKIYVAETELHMALRGRSIGDIGAELGAHPFDVLCDLSVEEGLRTRFSVVIANDDEAILADLLRDDRTLLGLSDAGAHASQLCDAVFSTYLLEYWVREKGVLSLEKAVWRLTDQPAQVFGLKDRGRIAPDYKADLVAFDPERIGVEKMERVFDLPAGADRLIAHSRGIEHTWVGGKPIRRDGQDLPDVRPGCLIRSND